ncbi:MAG TPA: dockerin type I domain-containing protein, partial [Chthoniobacterales bacterium]|nr:dockerin type I domain-containing protein [Chthoniobacterales bacterium]
STMTLGQPANTVPSIGGIGGSFFNLIDVAQGYLFDPILVGAVSRKTHGTAGTFDVDLMPPSSGIECRNGGANGDYQVVVTFAVPVTLSNANAVPASGGTASVVGTPIVNNNQVTINLTNVSNAQRLTINLLGVNDGTTTRDISVPMAVLIGDTTGNGAVNSSDISQTQSQSGQQVTSTNFRVDVTVNGAINSSDISFVQSKSGTALP